MADVTIDLSGFKSMQKMLSSDSPARRRILTRWSFRYRVFIERRFIKFSGGGGDWAPLKRKRRRGAKGRAALLRNTGLLLAALSPSVKGAPGAMETPSGFGVIVGYGGSSAHPGSRATIADIAGFHQTGAGALPVRKLIVPPPDAVLAQMRTDAIKIIDP